MLGHAPPTISDPDMDTAVVLPGEAMLGQPRLESSNSTTIPKKNANQVTCQATCQAVQTTLNTAAQVYNVIATGGRIIRIKLSNQLR